MSGAAAPPAAPRAAPTPPLAAEACPLCGTPLHPDQEWCLRCGAAARTRLAASPSWRAPLLGALAVAVLSLGVLAAALVKLAGDSGSTAPRATTLTSSPAAGSPAAAAPASTTPTSPIGTATTGTGAATSPTTPTLPSATTPSGTAAPKKLTPLLELERRRRQQSRSGK